MVVFVGVPRPWDFLNFRLISFPFFSKSVLLGREGCLKLPNLGKNLGKKKIVHTPAAAVACVQDFLLDLIILADSFKLEGH